MFHHLAFPHSLDSAPCIGPYKWTLPADCLLALAGKHKAKIGVNHQDFSFKSKGKQRFNGRTFEFSGLTVIDLPLDDPPIPCDLPFHSYQQALSPWYMFRPRLSEHG